MHRLSTILLLTLLLTAAPVIAAGPTQLPPGAEVSYLDNGVVKVGVDLRRGGAIVYLSRGDGPNLVNNYDLGRQIQLSFFSGPAPYKTQGQSPAPHWSHIGWNPIQAGDDFDNRSQVLAHRNDGKQLYVKCRPLHWPLNNVPGQCTFESWLELEGPVVKVRAQLNNARVDQKQYAARLQELPAVYANARYHRVVSYMGDKPFTGAAISQAPRPQGKHPWSSWMGTENWSALLDAKGNGLGLITPGRVHFTGGFAGQPADGSTPAARAGTRANSTGYLAGQGQEIIDHNITYKFRYELLPGSVQEIRHRAKKIQTNALPHWTFHSDRQSWHLRNAVDAGWPVRDGWRVDLSQDDPQLISPFFFVGASQAPELEIRAAIQSNSRHATVYWQRQAEGGERAANSLQFAVQPDGEFHSYVVKLTAAKTYRGGIVRLRLDPAPGGTAGHWVKIKSIRLLKSQAKPPEKTLP